LKKYRDIVRTVNKIANLLEYPHVFTIINFNSDYILAVFIGGNLMIRQKNDEKKYQKEFLLIKNFKEFSINEKPKIEEDIHKKARYLKSKMELFGIEMEDLSNALDDKLLELV